MSHSEQRHCFYIQERVTLSSHGGKSSVLACEHGVTCGARCMHAAAGSFAREHLEMNPKPGVRIEDVYKMTGTKDYTSQN